MQATSTRQKLRQELLSLTVPQLKQELVKRGLPVSGRKGELVARLVAEGSFVPAGQPEAPRTAIHPKAGRRVSSSSSSNRGSSTALGQAASRSFVQNGPAVMIVESPAKCKTIAKFAGEDFVVLACNGHVRALPSKPDSVRPEEEFRMQFELVSGAASVLKNLGASVRNARAVYLATDPDREGEAIAWHVHEALKDRKL